MKLKPITTWLEQLGVGTQGTDLFINEIPSECKNGIVLLDSYGGMPINPYLPGYKMGVFRAVVRSTDHDAGLARAFALVETFTVQTEQQLDGILLKMMQPLAEPRRYRRSVGGFYEFEFESDICYVDTP